MPRAVQQYQLWLRSTESAVVSTAQPSLEVTYNIAGGYARLGKRPEAKRAYAQYLLRDDTSERAGRVYYALASIAKEDNDLALAAQYLQKASQFSGASVAGMNQATFEAAELFYKNEEYANAISRYTEVAEKGVADSLKPYVLSRIIVSYFRLNNAREASHFEQQAAEPLERRYIQSGR